MRFIVKLLLANAVIVGCVHLGRRFPTLSGLIATMPITTLIVLLWLADDMPGNPRILTDYSRGVFWGIGPTLLFFAAATFCFRRQMSLSSTIAISFACWLAGALMHQWLVK
jgi:uncharacterized membrane protein (GlpM family)